MFEHQQDQLMYQQMVIDEAGAARTPVLQYAQEYRGEPVDLRIGNERETLAVDEKLCAELADKDANPLGELSLPEMNDAREKRAEQLAFMMMMHTKNRATQMITRLSDSVSGLEIWKRFLEEWEPVNRGRKRAMLMQLLQCPLTGSRGQPGGVGKSRTAARGAEFGHKQSSSTGTQPTGFRMGRVRQVERDETARV